jgi:uncharacterized protein YciI
MFIVLLQYIKPIEEIDRLIPEHRRFLERHYANGTFLLSGRQEPRTGGVILAKTDTKAALQHILEEDPFFTAGVATYQVVEFMPTMVADNLAELKLL